MQISHEDTKTRRSGARPLGPRAAGALERI